MKYFRLMISGETLKANGFGDYSCIDRDFQGKINIQWDKKSQTLTENVDDFA